MATHAKEKSSITVIVPAFNEEENLAAAYQTVLNAVSGNFSDWEILIVNDCSTDKTQAVASMLTASDPHVVLVNNPVNKGFGWNYKEGVRLARNEYVLMVPGDNEIDGESLRKMLAYAGIADILIPFPENSSIRAPMRRIISKTFVVLINTLFRLHIRYFNGTVLHKRSIIQNTSIETSGFAYQAEILVKLIRAGHSFAEVGMLLQPRLKGQSKAFKLKNIVSVVQTIVKLFFEVNFHNSSKHSKPIKKVELPT